MNLLKFKQQTFYQIINERFFYFLFFFLSLSYVGYAQNPTCGITMNENEYENYSSFIKNLSREAKVKARSSTQLPIHFVVIRDGSGNLPSSWDVSKMLSIMDFANASFTNGMSFYICDVTEFDNSTYAPFYNKAWGSVDDTSLFNLFNDNEAITVYIVDHINHPTLGTVNGYAYFPISNLRMVVLEGSAPPSTFAHELGHFFGLSHTFQGFTSGQDPNLPCIGDGVCDTPVDPGTTRVQGDGKCSSICSELTCIYGGIVYTPDKTNLMSSYGCRNSFTPDQFDIMDMAYATAPNLAYLQTPHSNCAPFFISDRGFIEKVDNATASVTTKVKNVKLSIEESGVFCNKQTNQHSPDFAYNPHTCNNYYAPIAKTVTVKPVNDDPDNPNFIEEPSLPTGAITTFDLVQISQHILNINPLPPPYSWIAADVNRSGTITSFDQVLIQQRILATTPTFAVTGAWQYVPNKYLSNSSFKTSFDANPFGASINGRTYTSNPSYLNEMDIDLSDVSASNNDTWSLKGIKMGDVNFSSILIDNNLISNPITTSRNNNVSKLSYRLDMRRRNCIEEGEEFTLEVIGEADADIAAYQLGFSFDKEALSISGVQKSNFGEYDIENFGLTKLNRGELRTLWFNEKGKNLKINRNNRKLFKLKLKALQSICNLEEVIKLDDNVLDNFFIDENGRFVETSLVFETKSTGNNGTLNQSESKILKVYPNPTHINLSFEVLLQKTEKVSILISDQYGNTTSKEDKLGKGEHIISIEEVSRLKSGILFYTVALGDELFTGTVIKH